MTRVAVLIAVAQVPDLRDGAEMAQFLRIGHRPDRLDLTIEDVQGVMIAIAPVVGTVRVLGAGGHIVRALGMAIAISDVELPDELDT